MCVRKSVLKAKQSWANGSELEDGLNDATKGFVTIHTLLLLRDVEDCGTTVMLLATFIFREASQEAGASLRHQFGTGNTETEVEGVGVLATLAQVRPTIQLAVSTSEDPASWSSAISCTESRDETSLNRLPESLTA